MPIPIPPPSTPGPVAPAPPSVLPRVSRSPYTVRQHQNWAVGQERYRHNGGLYWVGEWVVFFLLWTTIEFEHGLVERCHVCYRSGTEVENRVTAIYNQPTKQKCPDCLGTTFEGGYRARIVRPAILTDTDEDEKLAKRGVTHPANLTVETTVDFRAHSGDYMVRADNSRWQLSVPRRTTVRTGFEHPGQQGAGIAYGNMTASHEEPGQIVYQAPPVAGRDVAAVLTQPVAYVADFSGFEVVKAPLIPPDFVD